MSYADVYHYSESTGVRLAEWEAVALVDMGDALVRGLQARTPELPPLTTEAMDGILATNE